jgi:hypothetical protein
VAAGRGSLLSVISRQLQESIRQATAMIKNLLISLLFLMHRKDITKKIQVKLSKSVKIRQNPSEITNCTLFLLSLPNRCPNRLQSRRGKTI